MKYQDTWINGKLIESGTRECSERYSIIRKFCYSLPHKFTVIDIGANMSYFGIRLIEDFNCNVLAFEFHQYEQREKIISQQKTNNLLYLKRKVSLDDIKLISTFSHFNLVLALSVLHHVPGSIKEWIKELRLLGDNLIVEAAGSDSKRTATRIEYELPNDGEILGYGDSHLEQGYKRPLMLYKKP